MSEKPEDSQISDERNDLESILARLQRNAAAQQERAEALYSKTVVK
jgi:hypothetical protein